MSRHESASPREAPATQPSPVMRPFFVCVLLMDFAGGVGMLAVPLLATAWGASPGLLGYIGTAGGLGYVAMAAVAGPLSDRIGRTKLPLIGAVSLSLFFFLYPQLPGPVYMVPLALIIGIAWGSFWPPMESWIADVFEGRHLTRALSGFNISWSTGSTIGVLLAGYLFELRPWLPFLVTVLVPLGVAAALHRLPKPEHKAKNHSPAEDHPDPAAQADSTELWIAWTLNFAIVFALGATRNLFPKLADTIAISSGQISVIMFAMSLFRVLMFMLIRARGSMPHGVKMFLPPSLLLIVGMIGFTVGYAPLTFIAASIVVGISSGIAYSSSLQMSLSSSVGRGARSGAHEAILGSGLLAGPFVCGVVADHFGLRAPYVVCAVLAVVTLVAHTLILMGKRSRK